VEALAFINKATIKPYNPKTSAKIRIKIIPTKSLGCWAVPRTPASPTIPMANPENRLETKMGSVLVGTGSYLLPNQQAQQKDQRQAVKIQYTGGGSDGDLMIPGRRRRDHKYQ